MIKPVVPVFVIKTMRPAVVVVGFGKLRVWPAVVWFILNVVVTSTVVAAVPMLPPLAKLLIATAVNKLLLAFVKVLPVATVRPPLNVPSPDTVSVPVNVLLPAKLWEPVETSPG
jgi:hypothetical protein